MSKPTLKDADQLIMQLAAIVFHPKCADYVPYGLDDKTRSFIGRLSNADYEADRRMRESHPLLIAALKEAACWIPDGSSRTPEQKGAKCETLLDLETVIQDALKAAGEVQ